jgi:geranylgeranyl diphosphate synthase type II
MLSIQTYQKEILNFLKTYSLNQQPERLYQPIDYILNLGGKRLRPALTLMTTDMFGGHFKEALNAAMAIEVFHNFTLIHDDIMDGAPLRRGKETVHKKWNLNTGILSGDAMLILAYQLFENYEPGTFQSLVKLFSKTALEVCEGQQFDIDFETRAEVSISEYLKMIEYKTAVLLGAAMKMGAIIAKASVQDQDRIYQFGKNLGIAFQIQDDYLDAFGDPQTFGKQIGGDIIENKKTYLYLKAMEFSNAERKLELKQLFATQPKDSSQKIQRAKDIFRESGGAKATQQAIERYTNLAFLELEGIAVSQANKSRLKDFGLSLIKRTK